MTHRVILVEIDVLILDAAPWAFAEDVVEGAGKAVHADLNVGCEQAGGEVIGRELCALVGVEDLGPALAERLAQGIETEDVVQSGGKLPSEHLAAVPVDDSDQIHEATKHRHMGDVSAQEQAGPDALGTAASVDEDTAAPEVEFAAIRCDVVQNSEERSHYLGHIVENRFVTAPRLGPGESCSIHLDPDGVLHPFVVQANSKSMRFVDGQFAPEARELTIHARVIRYQGLVVQGYAPGDRVHVEVDGVARQPLESIDGRLLLYLQGPENRFADLTIIVRKL